MGQVGKRYHCESSGLVGLVIIKGGEGEPSCSCGSAMVLFQAKTLSSAE
jgi:hypothetical protein